MLIGQNMYLTVCKCEPSFVRTAIPSDNLDKNRKFFRKCRDEILDCVHVDVIENERAEWTFVLRASILV